MTMPGFRMVILLGALADLAGCARSASREACDESASAALSVCAGNAVVKGVDVSTYDGQVDWAAAIHTSGISFAFARVSDGTANPDDQFSRNWTVMKSYGVVRGAYQFFRPELDPKAQATLFLNALKANGGFDASDLPPVLDWEVTDGVDDATARANAHVWLDAMEQGTGKKPMLYTAEFMSATVGTEFASYPLWVANYGVNCPALPAGWSTWQFWQSTDTGTVAGLDGAVDVDEFNGTLSQLQGFAGVTADGGGASGAGHEDASTQQDGGTPHDAAVSPPSASPPASGGDAGSAMGSGTAGSAPSTPSGPASTPTCGQ